ncbi:MAG: translation initiation factor IF-3 [Verrucomicrobia bacterium]|nr:translation initiation factor IF-3 [Verrucomicrobiota bacterium]
MANQSGSGAGRGRYQRQNRGPQVRKNEQIRVPEVRLISPEGKQIGVVSKDEALRLARSVNLDLVEIAATARPPVCRILDFGKYMYELSKKQKETKAKAASASRIKEVKFRVRIEGHDYTTKLRRAEEFLYKGAKVKMTLSFRGREMEYTDLGMEVVRKAATDLLHIGSADSEPKLAGRNISMILSPLPKHKRVLKFNSFVDDRELEDDDEDADDEDHEDDEDQD